MPRLDEPGWATTEKAFAEWAADRHLDETDETFALFVAWSEGDPDDRRDITLPHPYFTDEEGEVPW